MSEQAGKEGPTHDFIPGWFVPREGNRDPAAREAVRTPQPGDRFPIAFLRSTETVRPAQRPQLGFTIGKVSERGRKLFDLAVPPGYWIVRYTDGHLRIWRDEDFKAKYRRTEYLSWRPPVERLDDGGLGAVAVEATVSGGDRPAWAGEPPAEGTRRRLILDTIGEYKEEHGNHPADRELADAIELALIDSAELDTEVEQEFRRLQAAVDRLERIARDDAWVTELAYQVAGAATRPLLEDHGDYVFPAERVQEAVAYLLETYFDIPRGGGCQKEQIEQGRERQSEGDRDRPGGSLAGLEVEKALNHLILARRETVDPAELARINEAITAAHVVVEPPSFTATAEAVRKEVGEEPPADDSLIKFLQAEVERLLDGREEARTLEGRFAEERDCAFALLRWLLPVTVAKRID